MVLFRYTMSKLYVNILYNTNLTVQVIFIGNRTKQRDSLLIEHE